MLDFSRMHAVRRTSTAMLWLAFLVMIPEGIAAAGTLREEALGYRTEGYHAQQRGDAPAALAWYQKAAALDPTYPAPLNDAGVLLEEQGRLAEAEAMYQQALAINPNYPQAHANLALLAARQGRTSLAVQHWMKRYQLGDPKDPWTARAKERLIALGVLNVAPELAGSLHTYRLAVDHEQEAHQQSLKEFDAVTEQYGEWRVR